MRNLELLGKILSLTFIMSLSLLLSCRGGNGHNNGCLQGDSIELKYSANLRMDSICRGVTLVTMRNPWDTTRTMAKYALIEEDHDDYGTLATDVMTVNVPLKRSVVYSGVHVSLIDELGAGDAITGICDLPYINCRSVRDRVEKGEVANCGQSSSPNIELIISRKSDALILSPYEKSNDMELFRKTGICVIEAADYMEKTPLARAEWMRFYGRLFGKGAQADALFAQIENNYLTLKNVAGKVTERPMVLFDRLYSGVWNVPTAGSVTGIMIEDAGGKNPFDYKSDSGSAQINAEEVIYLAKDADIWLIRYNESQLTLKGIAQDNSLYTKIKAYREGKVYGADTIATTLFEDGSFHPDKILREMIRLFHPEIETTPLQYYQQVK